MKPYQELTRRGRLRRLRKLAETALAEYGLKGAKLTFQHYGGNVVFRVDVPGAAALKDNGTYFPNRYNLRILTMNNPQATESEMIWLAALRDQAGLPVPEPVPTLDGRLLTTITTPGVPNGRVVSLMRWVDGRHIGKTPNQQQAQAWGELVAQLHNFAACWQPPEDFERLVWDWDGQLGNGVLRTPVAELIALMPDRYRQAFQSVSQDVKQVMEAFGKGLDAYGLIHADMYLENLLFKGTQPRLIDFEDCGYGYWMWDLGVIFSQWPWTPEFPRLKEAFFEGYAQIRTLPEAQFRHLDLFMAAQCATMVLWSTAYIKNDPAMTAEYEIWRTTEGDKLLRYFEL